MQKIIYSAKHKKSFWMLAVLIVSVIGWVWNPIFAQETEGEETKEATEVTEATTEETPEATEQAETTKATEAAGESAPQATGGQAIYEKRCAHCHGIEGEGDGPAADFFKPRPANFKRADYKYASTQKGELPTDDDLFRTVSLGLPGTGMPAWEKMLSEADRKAVITYIKTFSSKFADQTEPPKKIELGNKIAPSAESIAKGKELFFKVECNRCHGDEGRASGKNAVDMPFWPRNLTKGWTFRRTNAPEEIFQRITRGIGKRDMPSFAEGENVETTPEERWHIANYVHSLSPYEGNPPLKETIVAKRMDGALPDNPDDPIWAEMESYYFPLVGQVTIEPRMFTPTVEGVMVKALYNDTDVVLWVSWDDPTRSLVSEGAEGDDALALQFPSAIREGERPYFLMGTPDYPVYVARVNTASIGSNQRADASVEGEAPRDSLVEGALPSPVIELMAAGQEHGVGIRFSEQASQNFQGKVVYQHGQYRAVLKRALTTPDSSDLPFAPMQFIPIAFSAWDGGNGEVDSKRAVSAWYYLLLKPPDPPTKYIYPTLFAILVIGIEFWISRRYGKKK